MVEISPDIGVALGALQAVPGLGAFASVASLAVAVLGGDADPRVSIPEPFKAGSFLWGVPRRRPGQHERPEYSFRASYSVESLGGKSVHATSGGAGLSIEGFPTTLKYQGPTAGGTLSGPGGSAGLEIPTTQSPPYVVGDPHGVLKRNLTPADVVWAEAIRRGKGGAMAGAVLFAHTRQAAAGGIGGGGLGAGLRIVVHSVEMLSGWWDPWTDLEGGKLSDTFADALRESLTRLDQVKQDQPHFDDLDRRSWLQGGYVDAWQEAAAMQAGKLGELSSWATTSPKNPLAADALERWNAQREENELAYAQRREAWLQWRHLLKVTREKQAAFEVAQADWEAAYLAAAASGASPEQAADAANQALTYAAAPAAAAPAAEEAAAISPTQAVLALGAAALLLLA